ncbi:MAG: plastocyanin/azurin family copper-binding protein [Proteobacteria bacterium]|nr:plastocyanin/azurin family copper-binding protein [Pseudomonadota bacterium]
MKCPQLFLAFFGLMFNSMSLAKEHSVSQKNKAFSQDSLTIAAGDTVIFRNDDDTSHNVFSSTEGNKFNLGIQKQGADSKQIFSKAGEVEVRCAIHPKMKFKVIVK